MDEIYAESRFPAGFLPMRMCRWFPESELHPKLVVKGPDDFSWGDGF